MKNPSLRPTVFACCALFVSLAGACERRPAESVPQENTAQPEDNMAPSPITPEAPTAPPSTMQPPSTAQTTQIPSQADQGQEATGAEGTGAAQPGMQQANQGTQQADEGTQQAPGAQDELGARPRRRASGEPRATADERRDDPSATTPPRAQDDNAPQ